MTPLLLTTSAILLLLSSLPFISSQSPFGPLMSFGSAYAQYKFTTSEQPFFNHTLTPSATFGVMTHFWASGGPTPLIDTAIWRYYLDGETTPSITFTAQMLGGTAFPSSVAPWGHRWFGKGSANAGWYCNFRVPFHRFIRITGQIDPTYPNGTTATLWTITRGTENLPIIISGITLPPLTRLIQSRIDSVSYQPLDWVTLMDLPTGSGLLFSHTLKAVSNNLNFLEGCYHAYTPHGAPFPGLTMSSGTEDMFDSAWYFDAGEYRQENAGLTHFFSNSTHVEVSAYKMHENDPLFFSQGFSYQWRIGDVSDDAGHKCTLYKGGVPVGSPGVTVVSAYTFAYVWEDEGRVSAECGKCKVD